MIIPDIRNDKKNSRCFGKYCISMVSYQKGPTRHTYAW